MTTRAGKKPSKVYIVVIIILFLVLAALVGAMAINHYYPMSYSDIIFENAREFDLEPELIFAVIHAESRFRA
ncbi:MAG: hypothetical protein LBC73_05360, partial [Oscillospiraceae bacterium]|nr:hypothetical protein [Oscillospiraceae bacterium]